MIAAITSSGIGVSVLATTLNVRAGLRIYVLSPVRDFGVRTVLNSVFSVQTGSVASESPRDSEYESAHHSEYDSVIWILPEFAAYSNCASVGIEKGIPLALESLITNLTQSSYETISAGADGFLTEPVSDPITFFQSP